MQVFPLFSRKIHNDRRAFIKELFEALLAALRRGETAALCTILGASGSAPRGAGAKMAVFADGSTIGTVGGGSVELRTTEMAKEAILSK